VGVILSVKKWGLHILFERREWTVSLCRYEWGKTRLYLEGEICIFVCRERLGMEKEMGMV